MNLIEFRVHLCYLKLYIMSESEIPKIEDIPKFRKMKNIFRIVKIAKPVFFVLNPFLRLFGINTKEMREALKKFTELEKEFKELSKMPDEFNDLFASRGWIMFNFLNLDVVKTTLHIAKTDTDAAEKFLVESYTPEEVKRYLYMMHGIRAFRPRMELAEKALVDYAEERYHACIPVILALMDGLVNELNRQQNRSFFSDGSNLKAWDCITSHEKGLNSLKEVLHSGRYKTTTEEIFIPYRNGILHGMDLGYANKTVAAKTWAALFAVRDWAEKAEGKMLLEPPPEPTPTWNDLSQQIKGHKEWKDNWEKLFEDWKPRDIVINKGKFINGEPTDYESGTPENKVVEFLYFWKKKNFGNMARCLESSFKTSINKLALQVRERYQSSQLIDFEIIDIKDQAPAVSEVTVLITYEMNSESFTKTVDFRVLIYDKNNNPTIFGNSDANWFIMNWIFV